MQVESAKTVTLSDTVKYICQKAFTDCSNLSDIYIASESIQIDNNAFSTLYQRDCELTIHAPKTVMNSQTARILWDANYQEWNG